MLPSVDAAWVGAELANRFGLPVWQMAMTATDANRFVLRFARTLTGRPKVLVFDWCYHGSVDETLATLDGDGTPSFVPAPRRGLRSGADDGRRTLQRCRRARGAPSPPANRLRAGRTGVDQHRDRHAGSRLPRRAARGSPAHRHAAGDRRDAHDLRRPRRRDRGVGSTPTSSSSARRSVAACPSRPTA